MKKQIYLLKRRKYKLENTQIIERLVSVEEIPEEPLEENIESEEE